MDKFNKQFKVISTNEKLSDLEKISALESLLRQVEAEQKNIRDDYKTNFAKYEDHKSRFYWWQMVLTCCAGLITMSTATKSLEPADISILTEIICATAGSITFAGIGSMVAEELGAPIFKIDRKLKKADNMSITCENIRSVIVKLKQENGMELI